MKLSFDSLFSAKIQDHRFILLFGNDEGVIQRGLNFVISQIVPRGTKFTIIDESDFLSHSAAPRMGDLFGEPTPDVYLIDNCGERALKTLESLKETKNTYIFTSLKLRATSKVTTWVTRHGVSIGCYEAPLRKTEFSHLVRDLNLSNDLKTHLYQRTQKTPQRLQQIIPLLQIVDTVTTTLIDDLLQDEDTLCDPYTDLGLFFLCKDTSKVAQMLTQTPLTQTDYIPFLRGLLRSLQTVYEMKSLRGTSVALTNRPFFKNEPFFQRAVGLWSLADLQKLIKKTLELESKIKFSPSPLLLENFLLSQG